MSPFRALLKINSWAGTVTHATGLPEFSPKEDKEGHYIWRTMGDSKVRSSHSEREGQVFSWDHPPAGGHPGEAPGCRCWPEAVKVEKDCEELRRKIEAAENNLQKAEQRFNEAAKQFNEAQEAILQKREECDRQVKEFLIEAGFGGIAGGITGGALGAAREIGGSVAMHAEDIYGSCIDNGNESDQYKKAKDEMDSAVSWMMYYRKELEGYRSEYEQGKCQG
ncbi:MAG: minor capsid protein [Alphaproteobacteria bacterium]|nr:minor capsid protein [Alphaproteobacteria bacterium]